MLRLNEPPLLVRAFQEGIARRSVLSTGALKCGLCGGPILLGSLVEPSLREQDFVLGPVEASLMDRLRG